MYTVATFGQAVYASRAVRVASEMGLANTLPLVSVEIRRSGSATPPHFKLRIENWSSSPVDVQIARRGGHCSIRSYTTPVPPFRKRQPRLLSISGELLSNEASLEVLVANINSPVALSFVIQLERRRELLIANRRPLKSAGARVYGSPKSRMNSRRS